jgi:hypothetical protein
MNWLVLKAAILNARKGEDERRWCRCEQDKEGDEQKGVSLVPVRLDHYHQTPSGVLGRVFTMNRQQGQTRLLENMSSAMFYEGAVVSHVSTLVLAFRSVV